ncbi:signal transduction histidine kinase [Krasilnikovia cinnamomea]|uniref:histidine kinase n=1 Tax=Krasilnikovia cinnamomea TaxID=349313 RepID=A0A4Q7ZTN6_9ACTN|nr:sensor histidine kinase [Krasilnikovia cinnamomea]RZU53909.1 signal transduction histidine kinase [Krasilnikovia cinnamomea]
METRSWARDGLRAVGGGAGTAGLAITNLLLVAVALVALVLIPVPFLGLALLPWVMTLVRKRADLERRLAARAGIAIARPYRPRPERALPGGWRRFRWIVTDPATWRDLAWLVPGAVVGLALGLLAVAVPLYGVEGISLLPLWLYLSVDWYGYGFFWPIENLPQALLSLPQGVLFLAIGLTAAPLLLRVNALFTRLFLAPTKAAELRLRVAQLTVTRADTVDAQAAELRRIERDLHDGAQARLVSLGMTIGLAEELLERDPAAARRLLIEAREVSSTALLELRNLVRGIHPPVLAERGLDGAVRALAMSLPMPIAVELDLPGRPETPVESAAYFAVAEALANVVRHSRAGSARVSIRYAGGLLALVVSDDGRGGADPSRGTGLRGIQRRLAAFDGTMTVSSPPGGPTVVMMELPCVLSSPKTSPSSGTA